MKKTVYLLLLLFTLSLSAVLSSCKGDDPGAQEKTKTELISRNWKVRKVDSGNSTLYQEGAANNVENYGPYRLNFTSATNFSRTEKNSTTVTGTWQFASNETQIQFTVGGVTTQATIEELREDLLIISFTEAGSKPGQERNIRMELIPA